jgi:hypothetical protein
MKQDDTTTSVYALAEWLFGRLDTTEPRICVDPVLMASVHAMAHELKTRKSIDARPAYYSGILSRIVWGKPPRKAPRCGLSALLFLGELSEAAYKYDVPKVSVDRAVEMLIDSWNKGGLHYESSKGRWRIVSTPEFEEQWDFRVRIRLKSVVDVEDAIWQLNDLTCEVA